MCYPDPDSQDSGPYYHAQENWWVRRDREADERLARERELEMQAEEHEEIDRELELQAAREDDESFAEGDMEGDDFAFQEYQDTHANPMTVQPTPLVAALGSIAPIAPVPLATTPFVPTGLTVGIIAAVQARGPAQASTLLAMVPQRQAVTRLANPATGTTAPTLSSHLSGGMAHIVGAVAVQPCGRCADGFGPFTECVVVLQGVNGADRDYFLGACANCAYHARGNKCSLRGDNDNDEDVEDNHTGTGGKNTKGKGKNNKKPKKRTRRRGDDVDKAPKKPKRDGDGDGDGGSNLGGGVGAIGMGFLPSLIVA